MGQGGHRGGVVLVLPVVMASVFGSPSRANPCQIRYEVSILAMLIINRLRSAVYITSKYRPSFSASSASARAEDSQIFNALKECRDTNMCLVEGDYDVEEDYDEEEDYYEEEDSGSQELDASENTLEQVEEESVVG